MSMSMSMGVNMNMKTKMNTRMNVARVQDALAALVAAEMKKVIAKELAPAPIPLHVEDGHGPGHDELAALQVEEEDDEDEDNEDQGSDDNDSDEEGAGGSAAAKRRRQEKKTRKDRNKEVRNEVGGCFVQTARCALRAGATTAPSLGLHAKLHCTPSPSAAVCRCPMTSYAPLRAQGCVRGCLCLR